MAFGAYRYNYVNSVIANHNSFTAVDELLKFFFFFFFFFFFSKIIGLDVSCESSAKH